MSGPKLPDDLTDSSSAETRAVGTDATAAAASTGAEPDAPKPGLHLAEGELFGDKYRLIRRLGEGGMASVWVAHNEPLDVHVAIKFIRADLEHAGLTSRLLQEARAAAKLEHPAIVRVSDYGKTPRGDPYIVMELLNGEDLGATLRTRGPLNPLRAVRTLLPIADALATAHTKRIVHRDLKPENIFLSHNEEGKTQPKVVDFGIAKLENPDMQRITQLGAAMGSPAYMSPEQARGLDVDARTDIWALSVVLYETLTGRLPFTGNTYTALVCSILESKPTPITDYGVGDAQLWSIIARGLEKDAAARWQTMRELGSALARWAIEKGATEDITGGSLRSTWIERPADSGPMGFDKTAMTPSILPLEAEHQSSASGSGPAATQLSATVGGRAPARTKSTMMIFGVAAAFVLALGLGLVWKLSGKQANAIASEQSMPAAPPVVPKPEPPPVEPLVQTAAPEPPMSASAVPASKPTSTRGGKGTKPPEKPAVKPAEKPAVKPAEKPTQKPPDLDLKTNL
jgi:serine/threonine-protein kinase